MMEFSFWHLLSLLWAKSVLMPIYRYTNYKHRTFPTRTHTVDICARECMSNAPNKVRQANTHTHTHTLKNQSIKFHLMHPIPSMPTIHIAIRCNSTPFIWNWFQLLHTAICKRWFYSMAFIPTSIIHIECPIWLLVLQQCIQRATM